MRIIEKIKTLNCSKMNCKVNKRAFSLAEAMVMLVVISILLAVSAPLIAKKANADQRRLVVQGQNASVVTAMGGNQNFLIGTQNIPAGLNPAKLFVTSNRLLGSFVSTIANNAAGAHGNTIFQVTPGAVDPGRAANPLANANGFRVFADGTTNVRTCVPDYANASPSIALNNYEVLHNDANAGAAIQVTEDGYYVSSRPLAVYFTQANVNNNTPDVIFAPPVSILTDAAQCENGICGQTTIPVNGNTASITQITHRFLDSIIVPVNEGIFIKPYRAQRTLDLIDRVFFVPCAQPNR